MADLFVSYSRSDVDSVRRLCEALAARQREVWVDAEDIPPSAQWRDEIRAAIDAASVFVFVLSPASVASEECRRELDHAVLQGKRLVPVVIQKPEMATVPATLAELNWIFLHADDIAAGVDPLLQAVDTDLAWARAHAELLRRATAWQGAERDPGKLLRGRDLVEAERWLATDTSAPRPVAVQSAFVRASRDAAVRGQRVRLALAIAVAVVAIALSIWAVVERRVAQRRYQEAISRQLTIESSSVRNASADGLILSVQLAAEAMRRVPTPDADAELRAGLKLLPRQRWRAVLPTRTGIGVRFTPDGAHVVTADGVWDAASGTPPLELDHDGRTTHFAMSHDGRLIARIGTEQEIQLWERATGTQKRLQTVSTGAPFEAVALSRDGRWLAGADLSPTLHIWSTSAGKLITSLPLAEPTLSGSVRGLAFSPDGSYLAIARRMKVERWSSADWQRLDPEWAMQSGPIAAIDYASDGRLAMVSSTGEVVIYGPDGTTSARFHAPLETGRPETLRFSPSGRLLGVTTTERVLVVDAANGEPVLPPTRADTLVFAHDETRVAIGGKDRSARVIDLSDGRELARTVHGASVSSLDFSPDGATLVSMSDDGMLRMWDAHSAFPIAELRGTTGAFIHGGRYIYSMGERQAMEVWQRDDRRTLRLPKEGSPRQSMAAADGSRLVSVTGDVVTVWASPYTGEPVQLAHAAPIDWDAILRREVDERGGAIREVSPRLARSRDEGSVEVAAMSGDGRRVLTTRIDEIARLWDATNGILLAEIPYRVATSGAFSGDGTRLAVVSEPGVRILDAISGRKVAAIEMSGRIDEVLLGPDGRRLVARHDDGVTLWDVDALRPIATLKEVDAVRLAPDGRSFATEASNEAQWSDLATGKLLAEVSCQCRILDIVFSHDGRRIATVADDNRVYLRSIGGSEAGRDIEYSGRIGVAAFSPNGKLLAMIGEDPVMTETSDHPGQPRDTGHVEPWQQLIEVASGREIDLEQERAEGFAIVFSDDGRYLASGNVVWDTSAGRRIARAEGRILAFSPDSSLLLTRDGSFVRAWPWRSEDMLALACSQLTDNLTSQEWRDHVSRDEPPAKTCTGLP